MVRSNDSFNFPLGLIKYIVIVIVTPVSQETFTPSCISIGWAGRTPTQSVDPDPGTGPHTDPDLHTDPETDPNTDPETDPDQHTDPNTDPDQHTDPCKYRVVLLTVASVCVSVVIMMSEWVRCVTESKEKERWLNEWVDFNAREMTLWVLTLRRWLDLNFMTFFFFF